MRFHTKSLFSTELPPCTNRGRVPRERETDFNAARTCEIMTNTDVHLNKPQLNASVLFLNRPCLLSAGRYNKTLSVIVLPKARRFVFTS